MTIPEQTYRMGLARGKDTFAFLGRISQPADQGAYEDYIAGLGENSTVYRVTPKTEMASAPYANEKLIPRGNGEHEAALLSDVEQHLDGIRNSLIEQYADAYDYEEFTCAWPRDELTVGGIKAHIDTFQRWLEITANGC